MAFITVNWLSIAVAAAAAWIFGAIYYTAMSKPWLAAMGKTLEQCKAEQAAKTAVAKYAPFILAFVGELIMAWSLYGILVHLNAFTLRAGLIAGALIWFGFVLTTMTINNAFAGHRPMLTVIDAGGWLGALLIIGAIVGGMGR
jgi:Protein of unknown function (DUF1761)